METGGEFLAHLFIYLFFVWFWPLCRAGHATSQRSPPLWGARGSSPWRRIWEDFWWPRSWSKDKAWVIAATQTGNRRGLRWWGRGERCNFQKPNYFWDGGGKYHNNNSTRDEPRQGAGGDGGPVGKLQGGLKNKSFSKYVGIITIFGTTYKESGSLLRFILKSAASPRVWLWNSMWFIRLVFSSCRLWLENIDQIVQHVPLQPHWFLLLFSIFSCSCVLWQWRSVGMWNCNKSVIFNRKDKSDTSGQIKPHCPGPSLLRASPLQFFFFFHPSCSVCLCAHECVHVFVCVCRLRALNHSVHCATVSTASLHLIKPSFPPNN